MFGGQDFYSLYYMHDKTLGEGGFSKVKLATHLITGEKVAVKCMDKSRLGDDLFRVKTEIKALKTLNHENIARLLQVVENDEKIYLVMEYCSGGELFDYIVSKSRLSEAESKGILKALIQCLQYVHSKGFAHRDLKPENVLFDKNHNIKVIDFGLAAHPGDGYASLHHLKTCCGSPAYAAPELISGDEYSGPAADVWSAGVILYALLVGQLPFDDDNLTRLYKKIVSGDYKVPSSLSTNCKFVVQSMLNINPSQRITIDALLAHPWLADSDAHSRKKMIEVKLPASDEVILWEISKYFPNVTISKLRQKVFNDYGYERATYWLMKEKLAELQFDVPLKVPSVRKQHANVKILQNIPEEGDERKPAVAVKRKIFDAEENEPLENAVSQFVFGTPPKRISTVGNPSKIPVPLRALVTPHNNQVLKEKQIPELPFKKTETKTPRKTPKKEDRATVSAKKNFLKRILASATPSATSCPRTITDNALSRTKNITMTNFQDADECLHKLIQSLEATGIACKKKGFLMQCTYSNKYSTVLTFTLEVCLLGDKCVIQRKRLRGDAWNYKKICEAILRLSNDTVM